MLMGTIRGKLKQLKLQIARSFSSDSFAKFAQPYTYINGSHLEDANKAELVMTLKHDGVLGKVMEIFENHGVVPLNIDSKPTLIYKNQEATDFYLDFEKNEKWSSLQKAVNKLEQMPECLNIANLPIVPWFPQSLSDFDKYNKILRMGDGIEQSEHISFMDKDYVARRNYIAEVASNYKMDDPMIPIIDYNDNEKRTWKT